MTGSADQPGSATSILHDLQAGDASAAERLLPLIYDEMHAMAASLFRQERRGHTLQTTALVHDAYLRLIDQREANWQGRSHFLAVAAQAMRRILAHHAEKHRAAKRGGTWHRISLGDCESEGANDNPRFGDVDLLALDEALARLEALDERQCRVVELRFFGGLSVDETAVALGISPRLVKLDWQMARAWLHVQLAG